MQIRFATTHHDMHKNDLWAHIFSSNLLSSCIWLMMAFLVNKTKNNNVFPSFFSQARGICCYLSLCLSMSRDLTCVWLRYIELQRESKGIKNYHRLRRQNIDKVS